VLQTYKAQQRAERGFRFLKDPQFQATQFYREVPVVVRDRVRFS
jgi:transposase